MRAGDNFNRRAFLTRGRNNLARLVTIWDGQQQPARAVQVRQIHDLFVSGVA
ncbi:hypothetical protein D3C78_1719650 [compost metagenome]